MCGLLVSGTSEMLAQSVLGGAWSAVWPFLLIFIGFSSVIFVHELGHFMAAKWMDVRVDRFAIGFSSELVGFTKGETRYSFNILPLGGYVKMLGQEDFDDKTLELKNSGDPRSFLNKTVLQRAVIVSAGVVMNILFAAFLLVIVFMHGVETNSTTIGQVVPESPAAMAGLQPGDTVLKINGSVIREYQEISYSVVLADPHEALDFEIERDGEVRHVLVKPRPEQQRNLLQVGITSATTREVIFPVDTRFDPHNPDHLQSGDVVVAIEGEPLEEDPHGGIEQLWRTADGADVTVTVERPDNLLDLDSPMTRREAKVFNWMILDPDGPIENKYARSVLGLMPLVEVHSLAAKGRAALPWIKNRDVILKMGSHANHTHEQVADSLARSVKRLDPNRPASWRQRLYDHFTWSAESDIPVTVLRRGAPQPFALIVTPKIRDEDEPPLVGFQIGAVAGDTLRISGVQERVHGELTPAAEAGVPPGAKILAVGGKAVSTWGELVEAFRLAAGSTVRLGYETRDGEPVTCDFRVPHCLRTKLGVSTLGDIVSVAGQKSVKVQGETRQQYVSVVHSLGLYHALQRSLDANGGKPTTVTVRYRKKHYGEEFEETVALTADMIDPWLGRVRYLPEVYMQPQTEMFKADGLVDALAIGARKTGYFVLQVYTMMQRMIVSRSVGVEQMSGPVGIVKIGSDVARVGFIRLLFFLGIISANLAVINFLPLPIVDGGLMVFLIIEKIKGSPVSMKVQVVTQVIGVVLIGAAFLFVTFQDVVRLAG